MTVSVQVMAGVIGVFEFVIYFQSMARVLLKVLSHILRACGPCNVIF